MNNYLTEDKARSSGSPPGRPVELAEDLRRPLRLDDFRSPVVRMLIAAKEAVVEAEDRLHRVQVDVATGHANAHDLEKAEWEYLVAMQEFHRVREELIDDLLLTLRLAVDIRPCGLDLFIRQVPSVRRLWRRVRRLERITAAVAERTGLAKHGEVMRA
jgi:hypothetical protein